MILRIIFKIILKETEVIVLTSIFSLTNIYIHIW